MKKKRLANLYYIIKIPSKLNQYFYFLIKAVVYVSKTYNQHQSKFNSQKLD